MKNRIAWLAAWSLLSCSHFTGSSTLTPKKYTVVDYVKVGRMMDTIKTPYVVDVAGKTGKRIVFIGCVHNAEGNHPQFKAIGTYFNDLKPQVVFNEGGQIADSIHYATLSEAVQKDGETGVLKYYADKSGIEMLNGDLDARTEFALTLKKQPKADLYLYYVMERMAIPFHYGAYPDENFEQVFNRLVERHLVKNGFPLSAEEKTFRYFKELFLKNTGKAFDLNNLDLEAFDYINPDCRYCAVGRVSKTTRDSVMLSKIDAALDRYDRVMVTFGHGHAIAVKPALKELVNRKRNPQQ